MESEWIEKAVHYQKSGIPASVKIVEYLNAWATESGREILETHLVSPVPGVVLLIVKVSIPDADIPPQNADTDDAPPF